MSKSEASLPLRLLPLLPALLPGRLEFFLGSRKIKSRTMINEVLRMSLNSRVSVSVNILLLVATATFTVAV